MEIFGIGLGEMMVIAVVALLILGPERLPEAARAVGKGVAELRRATEPARSAWQELSNEVTTATSAAAARPRAAGEQAKEPTGNPWAEHPVMASMTEQERERFLAAGEFPERLRNDWGKTSAADPPLEGGADGVPQVNYPTPHSAGAGTPTVQAQLEELDYPPPRGG